MIWSRETIERNLDSCIVDATDCQVYLNTTKADKYSDVDCGKEIKKTILNSCLRKYGFAVIRSSTVAAQEPETIKKRLFVFANYLGKTLPQNQDGDHITELSISGRNEDWYEEQPYHTDGGDLLVLYCYRPATTGGVTKLASAQYIHQAIEKEAPELMSVYYDDWKFFRKDRPGQVKYISHIQYSTTPKKRELAVFFFQERYVRLKR